MFFGYAMLYITSCCKLFIYPMSSVTLAFALYLLHDYGLLCPGPGFKLGEISHSVYTIFVLKFYMDHTLHHTMLCYTNSYKNLFS
jgi:hypothetical protein